MLIPKLADDTELFNVQSLKKAYCLFRNSKRGVKRKKHIKSSITLNK